MVNDGKNTICSDMLPPDKAADPKDLGVAASATYLGISLKTSLAGVEVEAARNKETIFNII